MWQGGVEKKAWLCAGRRGCCAGLTAGPRLCWKLWSREALQNWPGLGQRARLLDHGLDSPFMTREGGVTREGHFLEGYESEPRTCRKAPCLGNSGPRFSQGQLILVIMISDQVSFP